VDDQTVLASGRPKATLEVRQGAQIGTTFPLAGDIVVLGREENVDIPIHDPEVSRRHARISWQAGRYILEDLNSTNGTYLNGVQITIPQPLQPGDQIGMGQTMLVFQTQAAPVTVQPPAAQPAPPPPPAAPPAESERGRSRCLLWGCGCLILLGLLLAIAAVVVTVVFAEDIQPIFDQLGIPIQLIMLHAPPLDLAQGPIIKFPV